MLTPLRRAMSARSRRGPFDLFTRIAHGRRPPLSTTKDQHPDIDVHPTGVLVQGARPRCNGGSHTPQQWTLVRAQTGPSRAPED